MKLEIEVPCNEDWNKMKIGMHSRHCDSCEKNVMDFTKMSRAEIILHLLTNSNDTTCGRMTQDQFDFRHEDIPILIETLRVKKPANAFLIIALVSLSLSSCAQDQKTIKTPETNIKVDSSYVFGNISDVETMGKVAVAPIKNDSVNPVSSSIDSLSIPEIQGEIILQGDVSIDYPLLGEISPIELPIEKEEPMDKAMAFSQVMPEYKGGVDAMHKFIKKNLVYPKHESKKGIQGLVYVQFIVERDGSLSNYDILQTVKGSVNFDKEVVRILNKMPKWTPGKQQGGDVRVYMTLPFQFVIESGE